MPTRNNNAEHDEEMEMLVAELQQTINDLTKERARAVRAEALAAEMREKNARLEGQLKESQSVSQAVLTRLVGPVVPEVRRDMRSFLVTMTPKQHAVVQMLLRGATNREIAERMMWREETAKGSIRNIGLRLGLTSGEHGRIRRENIDDLLRRGFEMIEPEEYGRIARIPKDWDATWTPKDREEHPFLYEKKFAGAEV